MTNRLHSCACDLWEKSGCILNLFVCLESSMSLASLNDEDGTADQRKEAFILVLFVHLVKLNNSGQYLRVIVPKVFCHLLIPGVLFAKEAANRHKIWLSLHTDRSLFEREGDLLD